MLGPSLQTFRATATEITLETSGEAGLPLCDAACKLVESLLLGITKHLPNVQADAFIFTPEQSASLDWKGGGFEHAVSIAVRFARVPIVGEIATRSRIPLDLRISEELRFALQPSVDMEHGAQVTLWTSGLEMWPLADAKVLRKKMESDLGAGYDLKAAYDWWRIHKEQFPLQSSKLRRVVDSLFSQPSAMLYPAWQLHDAFWGFTQADHGLEWKSFEFRTQGTGTSTWISITGDTFPDQAATAEEEATRRRDCEWARTAISKPSNRKGGDLCAASTTALGKMRHDKFLGLQGGKAALITKLFSAADWWGCGESGWTQWDETWLCTDRKNSFGKVVAEQGRVLWRLADEPDKQPSSLPSLLLTRRTHSEIEAIEKRTDCDSTQRSLCLTQPRSKLWWLQVLCGAVLLSFLQISMVGI
jgi:hypothetical protein